MQSGRSALDMACAGGHAEVVGILIQKGAAVYQKDEVSQLSQLCIEIVPSTRKSAM